MKIAVAILNWNGRKLLEDFLPSVVEYSSKATIYLIDNASTDDSVIFVRQNFPNIEIIKNKENYGFSKGYNVGLQEIKEEVVCLLNSDVEVTENWIESIESLFNRDQKIAVIQPKILDYKKRSYFEYAGAAGGFIDELGYPFCRGRIFDTLEEDRGQYNDETQIFWASGASFFIRKSIFEEVGGFDEDYFAHHEEIDLCWRIQNQGYKIYYSPNSKVYHLGGGTLSTMNSKKTFLNFRNSLFNLLKNLPLKHSIPKLFLRMILDGIAGFRFLFKGEFSHFFAIIQAHLSFYILTPKMLKKRTSSNQKHNMIIKSIVNEYFLKHETTFKMLFDD